MKLILNYLRIILIILLFAISLTLKTNIIQKRNGFRVLMNKEYLSNISNFWNAFLLNSQIKSKATHLSKCLKQVMKTITNFGNITQDISNNINSQGVTGLLSSLYSSSYPSLILRFLLFIYFFLKNYIFSVITIIFYLFIFTWYK